MLAEFSQRQIDYFHALPPGLRDLQTVRYGALALITHARVMQQLGDSGTGAQNIAEAIRLLEGVQRGGDRSEATLVELGRAYAAGCQISGNPSSPGSPDLCHRAVTLLEPLAERPGASRSVTEAYLAALTSLGWVDQTFGVDYAGAAQATERAMQIASALGAESLGDLELSADYAYAGSWRVNALVNLGRNEEALQVGKRVIAVADGVLAKRPWYRLTLSARENTAGSMVGAAEGELDPRAGQEFALQEQQSAQTLVSLDPGDAGMRNNFALALTDVCVPLWAGGHLDEALGWCRKSFAVWAPVSQSLAGGFVVQNQIPREPDGPLAGRGRDLAAALRSAASDQGLFAANSPHPPPRGSGWFGAGLDAQIVQAEVLYERGDSAAASRLAGQAVTQLQSAKSLGEVQKLAQAYLLYNFSNVYGHAEYQLGRYALAEHAERVALEQIPLVLPFASSVIESQRDSADISTWLAMALARQGKLRPAAQLIEPVVKFEEGLLARDHGDVWIPYELARALYAQALAEPTQRDALLKKAAALLSGLPPRLRSLRDVRRWQQWIARSLAAQ